MGWDELLSIRQEAADLAAQKRAQPPQACPQDGEPLRAGLDGRLFCPYDGWRPC